VKTENSASTNLSDFWQSLGEKFRRLHRVCPNLRADWNHVVGSGEPGEWTIAGGDRDLAMQFEALATRAASRLPGTDAADLLTGWLAALMREHIHFESEREGFETNADGSKAHHLRGTIGHLSEASAIYCSRLEARAVESELRARQRTAAQPDEAKEAAASTVEQSDTSSETQTPTELLEAAILRVIKAAAGKNPGKRGPRPDFETAMKVDEVVTRLAPDGNWRAQLDAVCEALDEDRVRCPKPWKVKGHRTWYDCMIAERPLVIKAIGHHRKLALEHKKTLS
jgi:hypothetical protein